MSAEGLRAAPIIDPVQCHVIATGQCQPPPATLFISELAPRQTPFFCLTRGLNVDSSHPFFCLATTREGWAVQKKGVPSHRVHIPPSFVTHKNPTTAVLRNGGRGCKCTHNTPFFSQLFIHTCDAIFVRCWTTEGGQ